MNLLFSEKNITNWLILVGVAKCPLVSNTAVLAYVFKSSSSPSVEPCLVHFLTDIHFYLPRRRPFPTGYLIMRILSTRQQRNSKIEIKYLFLYLHLAEHHSRGFSV